MEWDALKTPEWGRAILGVAEIKQYRYLMHTWRLLTRLKLGFYTLRYGFGRAETEHICVEFYSCSKLIWCRWDTFKFPTIITNSVAKLWRNNRIQLEIAFCPKSFPLIFIRAYKNAVSYPRWQGMTKGQEPITRLLLPS